MGLSKSEPPYAPADEEAILRLSDEEVERELDLAFDRSSKAMEEAIKQGYCTPRKISAAIREYRRRNSRQND